MGREFGFVRCKSARRSRPQGATRPPRARRLKRRERESRRNEAKLSDDTLRNKPNTASMSRSAVRLGIQQAKSDRFENPNEPNARPWVSRERSRGGRRERNSEERRKKEEEETGAEEGRAEEGKEQETGAEEGRAEEGKEQETGAEEGRRKKPERKNAEVRRRCRPDK